MKRYLLCILTLLILAGCTEPEPSNRQAVAPGIWQIQYGQTQDIDLLQASGSIPRWEVLETLESPDFPLDTARIATIYRDGETYLRFPLERDERIYGLGLHFKTMNQRGRILELHVDHYGGRDNGRTHAPVPFYVSTRGYGVFINAAEYLNVYAGTGVRTDAEDPPIIYDRNTDDDWDPQPYSDAVEILVPADGVEVFILAGPRLLDVVQRFNLLTGGGVLPPKWGLGFTHRVPRLYSDQDVLDEVDAFETHDFPLDFVGLEPGWQSQAYPCTFEWDPGRFPDPVGFIQTMRQKRVGVNLWSNPYVAPASSIFEALKPYACSHTVWNGWVPDYTMNEPRSIFQQHIEDELVGVGVEGFKIDEVDGYDVWLWPDVATFPSGHTATQMRQIYGLLVQDVIDEVYRKQNRRTYGLVRATNAGGAGLPFVIYNDYYSHRDFITALTNSSFIGVLWTPEVRASESAEEWLRRMQSVCFSPLAMINAWADGTKPWSFPEVEAEVRRTSYLRMQLLPYLYTAFARYYFEGIPPIQALHLRWNPTSTATSDWEQAIREGINDQFMIGEHLMMAPMFAGESTRRVVFPEGKWYDFFTGELVGEAEVREMTIPPDQIPLYVRDGGIIPMLPPIRHAPRAGEQHSLTIRHYGEQTGTYALYDDDGETFDYEQEAYQWRTIEVTRSGNQWTGAITPPEAGKPDSYSTVAWQFMEP